MSRHSPLNRGEGAENGPALPHILPVADVELPSGYSQEPVAHDLPVGVVEVWRLVCHAADSVDRLLPALDVDEQRRAARLATPALRCAFVAAHHGLRDVLASYLSVVPADVRFVRRPCSRCGGPHGKPAVAAPDGWLRFNLAHSADVAVVAVARDVEVGVDVERVREDVDLAPLLPLVLSASERSELDTRQRHERAGEFYRIWTRKEALLKARGDGLQGSLPSLGPQASTSLDEDCRRWTVVDLEFGGPYAAALAVEGSSAPQVVIRDREPRSELPVPPLR